MGQFRVSRATGMTRFHHADHGCAKRRSHARRCSSARAGSRRAGRNARQRLALASRWGGVRSIRRRLDMRKSLCAISLAAVAAAALAMPAQAAARQRDYVAPAAGVVGGTVVGLGLTEGWWGTAPAIAGTALPTTAGGRGGNRRCGRHRRRRAGRRGNPALRRLPCHVPAERTVLRRAQRAADRISGARGSHCAGLSSRPSRASLLPLSKRAIRITGRSHAPGDFLRGS